MQSARRSPSNCVASREHSNYLSGILTSRADVLEPRLGGTAKWKGSEAAAKSCTQREMVFSLRSHSCDAPGSTDTG